MDPLTIFGAAANAAQCVDVTWRTLKGTHELYHSATGATKQQQVLLLITQSLQQTVDALSMSINSEGHNLTTKEENLEVLLKECRVVADGVIVKLNKLGMDSRSSNRKWASLLQSVRNQWAQSEMKEIESQLNSFRQQISVYLMVSIREQLSRVQDKRSMHLDQTSVVPQVPDMNARGLLNTIIPQSEIDKWQSDIIAAIHQSHLKGDFSGTTRFFDGTDKKEETRIEGSILRLLEFREMRDRQQDIPKAYRNTFNWIFNSPKMSQLNSQPFEDWLRSGEKLYWITGKAGSGKSTLMKYIHTHPQPRTVLEHRAPDTRVVLANFFFWNSGTQLQMSQLGMLRTLLHEVLKDTCDLIPQVFPHRWEALGLFDRDRHPWSVQELFRALRVFLEKTRSTHTILFAIDGLDEFEGESSQLVDLIKELSTWPHVKVCVSSRPWILFEDAFKKGPSLTMERLTRADIEAYVRGKFKRNDGFLVLQAAEFQYAQKLLSAITQKASGVFLWVVLVVRSLLLGLTSGDRISDLEARLKAIPGDLESLFWGMLSSSGPEAFGRAAELIKIVQAATNPTLLELAFADDDFQRVFDRLLIYMKDSEKNARAERMRRRVNSICKGLLEVNLGREGRLPSARVYYMHRTVKDYLEQGAVKKKLAAATDPQFNCSASWCKVYIMWLKTGIPPQVEFEIDNFWGELGACLRLAETARADGYENIFALYDAIDCTAASVLERGDRLKQIPRSWITDGTGQWNLACKNRIAGRSFLNFAAQTQGIPFLLKTLVEVSSDINQGCPPLIYAATNAFEIFSEGRTISQVKTGPNVDLVRFLLDHGADLHVIYENESIWRRILCAAILEGPRNGSPVDNFHHQYRTPNGEVGISSVGRARNSAGNPSLDQTVQVTYEDPVSNTPIAKSEKEVRSLWISILKICLGHGARPQDAVELLADEDVYSEVLEMAKSLIPNDSNADPGSGKSHQTMRRGIWSRFRRSLKH